VQVKIQAVLWHVLHTWWYVWIISVSACREGDWCHCFVLLWHVQFTIFIFLSEVKMMTSIRMKPWLSNLMIFVKVHASQAYWLFLRVDYLYSLCQCFH
jgi:hypothetical protein